MMPAVVQEVTLVPASEPLSLVAMIERAVKDPSIDVEKLERMVQMHERAMVRVSREQFNAAMSAAQKAMRPVAKDADNPQTRSRYASYQALDAVLRPLYTEHGFGLSFNTGESPLPEHVRVLCDVTHVGGHEKQYQIDMPSDGKGAKGGDVMTKTHATGAATAYGMRYLLKMIWNVAVGEADRDGNTVAGVPTEPAGFEAWMADFEATADMGYPAMREAWADSKPIFRDFATKHYKGKLEALKVKSKAVAQ